METFEVQLNGDGFQQIEFPGTDESDTIEIYANDVTIVPSSGEHSTGSPKVKLQNVVDYSWEQKFNTGQLLAVHMGGKYIAYGILAPGKAAGIVRVLNRNTSDRALIKGMDGMVEDIAFAHTTQQIMLACVDKIGNLFVYSIEDNKNSGLICSKLLHVEPDQDVLKNPVTHRVIWCPYIPEGDPSSLESAYDGVAHLLALTRGTKIELWDVGMVTSKHGLGPVKTGDVDEGYLQINEHSQMIVDAAFSPDGTAIATASLDGDVKFFQVYMQNGGEPRCLHEWQPHGGKPLSSLFFLDNHKNYNPDIQFWKFAITGANLNSELKLWSCESWTCLQTVRFLPRAGKNTKVELKACVDLGSGYLLLSNMDHRVLYVLRIQKDASEMNCFFQSVSEFPLPYPILSFGIVDAGMHRFKSNTSFTLDDICNGETDEDEQVHQFAVVVRMYLVQPKSLQECHIVFQPPPSSLVDGSSGHSVSQDSLGYRGEMLDLNVSVSETVPVPVPVPVPPPVTELPANHSSLQLNLMTPDAFNSPVKHDSPISSVISLPTDSSTVHMVDTTFDGSPNVLSNPTSPLPETTQQRVERVVGFASGGSSPSREVQEILSLQAPQCYFPDSEKPLQTHADEEDLEPEPKPDEPEWPLTTTILLSTESRIEEENTTRNGGQINRLALDFSDFKNNVSDSLALIQSLLVKQDEEIKNIREEIKRQNSSREFEKVVSRQIQQQSAVFEKALSLKDDRQNQEVLISAISQAINNLVSTKLDDIVVTEISNSILPAMVNSMENLKHQLHREMTQKLSATDHLLKENITKLIHSKSVMEVLSNALVNALTPCLQQTYREYFMNVALPSHEKACATMFAQINDSFAKGTKEYLTVLETHSKKITERGRDSALQVQSSAEIIKNSAHQISSDIKKAITSIESSVGDALRAQQTALEGSVIAAVRSGAVTPAPHILDTQIQQQQIMALISQGQINVAFQQALSASDLNVVMMVCEKVNPQQVFNQTPCPLHQHVLLSLIQQLSADMNSQTELKYKYLEEAVLNLDITNPSTKEHMPAVLNNLRRQLQAYITSNPNNKITRDMRMLAMAAQSLLAT